MKPVEFRGDSLDCLREFPRDARREAGFQLDRVQRGLEPQKKTQATAKRDLDLAAKRYRELMKEQP